MNRYRVTYGDGYGRTIRAEEVSAASLRLALLISEQVLRGMAERGDRAVTAGVELVVDGPGFSCLVDESAGLRETCPRCGREVVGGVPSPCPACATLDPDWTPAGAYSHAEGLLAASREEPGDGR